MSANNSDSLIVKLGRILWIIMWVLVFVNIAYHWLSYQRIWPLSVIFLLVFGVSLSNVVSGHTYCYYERVESQSCVYGCVCTGNPVGDNELFGISYTAKVAQEVSGVFGSFTPIPLRCSPSLSCPNAIITLEGHDP